MLAEMKHSPQRRTIAMKSPALFAAALVFSSSAHAQVVGDSLPSQSREPIVIHIPASAPWFQSPPKDYCVYSDRIYSSGATICVAAGEMNECLRGGTWQMKPAAKCERPINR
jgi:hypothetical protein